jgi:uncharacterized protein YjbI with pentapeptide repeats
MSTSAPFLGKMFICRDGNPADPYGTGGTTFRFNVYANGRNEGADFTGVACQAVAPVTGPGKPSDLKHLTRGTARPGEPGLYVPLVAGADADSRHFGIDFGSTPHLFQSRYLPDEALPAGSPFAGIFERIRQLNPDAYHLLVARFLGPFGCHSANASTGYQFGDIMWWWGVGWLPAAMTNPAFNWLVSDNRCTLYSSTPSAADWRAGAVRRPSADYEWCDLSGEDYSHLSFNSLRARFGNADLTGTDFTGANLAYADFRGVYSLKHAKLVNATLDGANLSAVDLEGVDLSGASLIGTDLSHTDLTKAIFNAPPKLSHDINVRTSFAHSKVPWGVLHDSTRDGEAIDLTALVLAYADLVGVPQVLHHFDASNADVRGIVLSYRDLRGAKFVHARCEGIHLSGCMLAGATFEFAFLGSDEGRSAELDNANLMGASFFNADLTGSILTGAYLWGSSATLEKATLVQTDFTNAYLVATDFRGIANKQCSGVNFSGACLVNAQFGGTTTQKYLSQPTNFDNSCLQGASFDGATLLDTTLSNATVSFGSGTFPASVKMRWPTEMVTLTPPLAYQATTGLQAASTATTTCPSSTNGPCTDAQLHNVNPVTSWPPGSS